MNPQFPHMVALFWLYTGLLAAVARMSSTPTLVANIGVNRTNETG
jgi:hypothetical protein